MDYRLPPVFRGASMVAAPGSWAMPLWNVAALRGLSNGEGVKTAVLDTGGDIRHPDLANRIVKSKDFTGSRGGPNDDRNQHGTHCLGTVGAANPEIGVSQGCELYCGKVLSDSGSGGDPGIAAGVDWAVAEGCEVISMSLGGGYSTTIEAACNRASEAGCWVIVAAGNSGAGGVDYPGKLASCISVAAIDRAFKVANFSSRGDKLDCSGPGVDITSCKPGGGYQNMSGTSMATPFIAGVMTLLRAAMKKQGNLIRTEELRTLLGSRTVDLGAPGDDRDYGPGWCSPLMLAIGLTPPPPPIVI